jgi:extradiol dioxygenase family protein
VEPLILERRPTRIGPAGGLARAEHFQIAYATNDIDRAMAVFSERLGISEFRRLEGPLPAGGTVRVELAWVGTVMYELISATGEGSAIYMDRLPASDGFALRHHHFGYVLESRAQFDALFGGGWPVVHHSVNAGFMETCFVDADELGHYLEYFLLEPAGREFLAAVPRT